MQLFEILPLILILKKGTEIVQIMELEKKYITFTTVKRINKISNFTTEINPIYYENSKISFSFIIT